MEQKLNKRIKRLKRSVKSIKKRKRIQVYQWGIKLASYASPANI